MCLDKNEFASSVVIYPLTFIYTVFESWSILVKKEYESIFSYEYLVGILNSEVYNKYFKINAKKISKNVYDYYPNKVMNLLL